MFDLVLLMLRYQVQASIVNLLDNAGGMLALACVAAVLFGIEWRRVRGR